LLLVREPPSSTDRQVEIDLESSKQPCQGEWPDIWSWTLECQREILDLPLCEDPVWIGVRRRVSQTDLDLVLWFEESELKVRHASSVKAGASQLALFDGLLAAMTHPEDCLENEAISSARPRRVVFEDVVSTQKLHSFLAQVCVRTSYEVDPVPKHLFKEVVDALDSHWDGSGEDISYRLSW
jgi:hypothetical protein